jgi:group I intron endonuclease
MHIYLFINKTNNKMYVGQSVQEPDARFKAHKSNAKSETYRDKQAITRAIHKYGWDGFTRHVLEVCESQEAMNLAETYWVAHYNCMSPLGYNLTTGGGNFGKQSAETIEKRAAAHRGRKCSDATRKKMSESKLGKVISEDHRRKCAENFRKAAEQNTGVPLSEETKEKLRQAMKGRKPSAAAFSDECRGKMASAAAQWWAEERGRIAQGMPPRRGSKKT